MKSQSSKPKVDTSRSVAHHLAKASTSNPSMQFKDERADAKEERFFSQELNPESTIQNSEIESGKNSSPKASVVPSALQTIQRVQRSDHGAGESKRLYADQISATKTENAIKVLVVSAQKDSEGVFLSDDMNEWGQSKWTSGNGVVNRLVLPDYGALLKDDSKTSNGLKNNEQSLLQNCRMVAEHELMHLKHASENGKKKNGLGAQTGLGEFDNAHIENTVADLKKDIGSIYIGINRNSPVLRLLNMSKYIDNRLGYILSVWGRGQGNVEAPAVLRELRRYLDNTLKGNEGKTWTNFQTKIKGLDDRCSDLVGAKIGGCYLTEACTTAMGLADDCVELTLLRQFRDNYLAHQPSGHQLINIYYQYAPKILLAIRQRDDEEEILRKLYAIIHQCVGQIKSNKLEACFDTYCKMTYEIAHEFIPELMTEIGNKVPVLN